MKIWISPDGRVVSGIRDELMDRFRGNQTVKRLSNVEFNGNTQVWEATDLSTNKIIASAKTRKECLKKEVAYYEKQNSDKKLS